MELSINNIEMIEDLPLRASDRWYVFLALTGQKRASWLTIESDVWREGDEPIRIPEEQIRRLKTTFNKLGLSYKLRFRDSSAGLFQPDEPSEFRQRYNQICDIYIGDTEDIVNELAAAVEVMDHKRIGLALGYPKTAVDAFGTEDSVLVKGKSKSNTYTCEPYVWFKLSPNHSDEELAVVQGWYNSVIARSEILRIELKKEK